MSDIHLREMLMHCREWLQGTDKGAARIQAIDAVLAAEPIRQEAAEPYRSVSEGRVPPGWPTDHMRQPPAEPIRQEAEALTDESIMEIAHEAEDWLDFARRLLAHKGAA